MTEMFRTLRRAAPLFALPTLLLAACDDDATAPEPSGGAEVAVVANSTENSLSVIPVDDPSGAYIVGVSPEGSPVSVAARGSVAVVPLGTYPYVAVVDLAERAVRHTVALPAGSGATGAAFLNDSIALVGNPALNSVTPVNVRTGVAGAQIPVGAYPHEIVAGDGFAYVLNAQLESFVPARPGTVTVIDGSLNPVATIQLRGLNPGSGALGPDGRLYVVNSGTFGGGNGSLSVVDLSTRREVEYHDGFGDFPGAVAAAEGRVLVSLYGLGIVEWSPSASAFVHAPSAPLTPGGIPPVADLAFDSEGRLFALNPEGCTDPGVAYRLSEAGAVEATYATGVCPFSLAFGRLPE